MAGLIWIMPALLLTLVVPTLSRQNVNRLLEAYLTNHPPHVDVWFGHKATEPYYKALERVGVVKYAGPTYPDCDGTFPTYALGAHGAAIASAHGWKIEGARGYMPDGLEITLGTFALVPNSIVLMKPHRRPTFGSGKAQVAYFKYVLRGNSNVRYLLSLAPATIWGDVGVDGGGGIVPLNKAGQIVRDKLMLENDGKGWYVNEDPYPLPPAPHCDYGVPQSAGTPAPSPTPG